MCWGGKQPIFRRKCEPRREQRQQGWEGAGGQRRGGTGQRGAGAGAVRAGSHTPLCPFSHGRSRDEQWALLETQLGGCTRDSRRTKVKRSLRLQVVQRQMPVTSPASLKGGFSHRPVLTSSWGPPAALLKEGKVSSHLAGIQNLSGGGGGTGDEPPDGPLLPPSPTPKALPREDHRLRPRNAAEACHLRFPAQPL